MKRIVIIGGGIAGLSAAFSLKEQAAETGVELDITLLERKDRLGGNISTEKTGGFLIEGGPDCFLSEKPWAMALCKRIGLADSLLPTNDRNRKTFVLSRGRLLELPEGFILMVPTRVVPFLASPLISIAGKIRMGMELFVPRKRGDEDESLGDFVTRRLGKEALDKIAEPLVAGVHAGDPDTMSVRASFPKFVAMEQESGSLIRGMLARMRKLKKPADAAGARGGGGGGGGGPQVTMFMTLKGGLVELVDAIVERLPNVSIRTGVEVSGVRKTDAGYEVLTREGERGEEGVVSADCVVVAAPAYVASRVLKGLDHELAEKLLTIPYVSTATVSIGYRKADITHPLNGFGFVVPRSEGRRIMAASWVSSKFDGRVPEGSVLIRCFIGGAKREDLVFASDEDMARFVREELKDIMGIDAEPVIMKIFRWKNAMPQYTIGHEGRIESIEQRVSRHQGLFLTGSAYRGIGISDCVRLGEETAKSILKGGD